jgi:hypothetical protein
MGPGTTAASLHGRAAAPIQVARSLCIDWGAVPRGFLHIATIHWPLLFATKVAPVRQFNIESDVVQGASGAGLVLGIAMLVALIRIAARLAREREWRREYDLCAYLVLVGVLSVSGYVIGRCGGVAPVKMRYDMLSILGAVGLAALYLRVERATWLKAGWLVLLLTWAACSATAHGRLWWEYLDRPPVGGKRRIAQELQARGIRYGIAPFETAYPVTFLTGEQIIVASSNRIRILAYQTEFRAHRNEAVRIERGPCPRGTRAIAGVYFCAP